MRYLATSCIFALGVLLLGMSAPPAQAAAPARTSAWAQANGFPGGDRPYAEATLCASPDVIFCEDFNYPEHFTCGIRSCGAVDSQNSMWYNPGLIDGLFGYVSGLNGRLLTPATSYLAKPQGSMPSASQADGVWVANWDASKNGGQTGPANTWGMLRRSGGNYANGMPPVTDWHVRFQIYLTSDWKHPGDPKLDVYNLESYPCVDTKWLAMFPTEGIPNPTSAAYGPDIYTNCTIFDPQTGGRFADAIVIRYGNSSDSFKHFPQDSDAQFNNRHEEYDYQLHNGQLPLRNPNDTPILGKLFRVNDSRWYTIEMRYKLSNPTGAPNGIVELWVDGTKVYSANDLRTCEDGLGDCTGLGAFAVQSYHNISDVTPWDGQQVIDNFVISRSYIGPPSGGSVGGGGDATPPAAPLNLRIQ